MATRNSYMPKQYTNVAVSQKLHPIMSKNLTGALWTNAIVRGTAKYSDAILSGAAVVVWTGAVGSIGNAYAITFTDANGRYAVTVKTSNNNIAIKVYG